MIECKHVWKQTEIHGTQCNLCGVRYQRPKLDWEKIAELEAENEKYRLGMQENCQLRKDLVNAERLIREQDQTIIAVTADVRKANVKELAAENKALKQLVVEADLQGFGSFAFMKRVKAALEKK